ncbi:MAG: DUF11 domain-containing protein, partial [Pyrinomonadaceae bacterium]|nr:DUF11 domain-containing protein [Phycisphaerales bacterium]
GGVGLGTTSIRIYAALTTDLSGNPRMIWMDLDNTTPSGIDGQAATLFDGAANGMGQVTIALAGNFAFVQSDIRGTTADFNIIDVCPSSPTFGQGVLNQPGYNDITANLRASVTQVSGGDVTIGTFSNGMPFGPGAIRPDCPTTPPPPPTGACCVSGVCTPAVTSAACTAMGGTWSLGLGCSPNHCPQPMAQLTLTMTGPATAVRGLPITYTLTYENIGPIPASNVMIRDALPAGSTFLSASGGGVFGGGDVNWSFTSVPAMSGPQQLTLTVRAPCSGASMVNSDYTIVADGLPIVSGAPPVTSTLTAPPLAPVTMSVASVPARQPLQGGDVVTHTITLTNTISETRGNLNIAFINAGRSSRWLQVIDHGGGVAAIQPNGTALSWNGSIAPSATVTIVASTRVVDCINASDTQTQLHDGQQIRLTDACFNLLGSAVAPGPFSLLKPVTATIAVSNLLPGQVGPAAQGGVFGTGTYYQAIRDGAMLELSVQITNQLAVTIPDVAFSMVVPGSITLSAAPLLAPVPAGAMYDAGTRTISYLGAVAAGATLSIRFGGTMSAAGECQINLAGLAGFGASCRNVRAEVALLVVPPLPTQTYMLGVYSFRGLFTFTPGVDTSLQNLLCLQGETYPGMGRSPSGDVLVVGLPNFIFNPETLDLQFLDAALRAAGVQNPDDGAIDPTDGTVILTGVGSGTRIVRLDPVTSVVTTIIDEPAFGGTRSVIVDPDGSIVFLTGSQGMRRIVDAHTGPFPIPASATVQIPLPVPDYSDVPMGTQFGPSTPVKMVSTPSGDYSVVASTTFITGNVYTQPNALIDVQRSSGIATLVNRAITAASYSLSTGLPLSLPAGLNALAFSDGYNDAFARSSELFYALPTGGGNTNLTVINTTTTPHSIVGDFPHPAFAAYDAEVVAAPPACPADFNNDSLLNSQDFFDFLAAFFSLLPSADFNGDAFVNSQDFFDFVAAFFVGC